MRKIIQDKKAQLTLFIIIGLVLIMVTAGILFLRQPDETAVIEEVIEEVPMQVKPIQEFVSSCLYSTAKEALVLMGQHGGYIDMSDSTLSKRTFVLDPINPTESDAAFFNMRKESHVAYWWYLKSKNTCTDCIVSNDNKPGLNDMENQLNTYIEENIDSCLDGFRNFKQEGFSITATGKPKADGVIAEKDILVRLTYPMEVNIANRSTNITMFLTKLDIDLKHLHEFADKLTRAEANDVFLEQIVKHVISLSSGTGFSKLPPTFAVESSFVPLSWSKSLVKLQLQSLFTSYIPLLQINQTRGALEINFSGNRSVQNLYRPFFVDVLNQSYPKYSVRFFYLNWPVYFDITPSEGELIKPSQIINVKRGMGGFFIPFVFKPMNYYEYFYDLSFPVIAEIKSNDEFFNETYTFLIAFEVNLRDNKDLKEWFEGKGTLGPWDYTSFGLRATEDVQEALESEEGIDKDEIAKMPVISGNYTKTLFCNSKQRISGEIAVSVTDKQNGSGIDGAEVHYSCGSYETCRMGRTKTNSTSGDAILAGSFPVCVGGGILRVEKEGYMTERVVEITTLPGIDQTFAVELEPIVIKKFSVKKYMMDRIVVNDSLAEEIKIFGWNGALRDMDDYDMVLISLTKINETPWEEKFSRFILYYGNDSKNDEYFSSIGLIPGKYTVDIQYFYTNKTVIPANCSHLCDECGTDYCEKSCRLDPEGYRYYCSEYSVLTGVLSAGLASCAPCGECDVDMFQPEEPIDLGTQILGGFKLNASNPWVINNDDLTATNRNVEFRLVHAPLPRCLDDLSELENVSAFYSVMAGSLTPRFI